MRAVGIYKTSKFEGHMSMLIKFAHDSLPYSVVIEEDDKVAYAYLLFNDDIISDVWLYNCVQTPQCPEWNDVNNAPFLNPAEYASRSSMIRLCGSDNVLVEWKIIDGKLIQAEILNEDTLLAILSPDTKPGYCNNAIKDGPLAKCLIEQV